MKKIVALIAIVSMVSSMLIGCGSFRVQNEYITVKQYKELEVKEPTAAEITDEQVNADIANMQEMHSTLKEIEDRPAQEGDTVNIDYKGLKDGEAFERGSQEGADVVLGEGGFIDGFLEGIIGRNVGDEFEVDVTFPDPYDNNPDLAGQPAVFEMKLNSISEKELPELDDDFAKKASETATSMDELKIEVKKKLEEISKENAEGEIEGQVWKALQDSIEVKKMPEDQLTAEKNRIRAEYEEYAQSMGTTLEDFLSTYMENMDLASFEETLEKNATMRIALEMAIELIAKKEQLVPTNEEFEKIYEEMALEHGFASADDLKQQATEEQLRIIILQERVGEFLVENAKQISAEEWEEKNANANPAHGEEGHVHEEGEE